MKTQKKFTADDIRLTSMCAVPILIVFVFCYLPMIGIIMAFKNFKYNKGIFGSDWVGLDNFKTFILSNDFMVLLKNTLVNNALMIAFSTAAAVALAVLLFNLKSRSKTKFFQTVFITPHFISWVVVGYIVYSFLNPSYGIVNSLLKMMELPEVEWYSIPWLWIPILVITETWKTIGMNSVIYYATLMSIDESLFEAARMDGAGKWMITKKIILPELASIVTIMTIMAIGKIFRADFGLFYFVPRNVGALYPVTDVFDTYIFRQMRIDNNLNISAAAGLLQSVVGFICVMVTNHVVNRVDSDKALF
ncbi:ABC transporter permease subunit [Ructibacterium gallinarum]|nr:ABC transporter permease subunit [Ructibacterium gallinarum]